VEARTAELADAARTELDEVIGMGGAFEAIDELKARLVRSQSERTRRIETGELKVIGVNSYTDSATSPLNPNSEEEGLEGNFLTVDPAVEARQREDVARWRQQRDGSAVSGALDELRRAAETGDNIMPPTVALAHAGGTTGEWAGALREVFGEYRAPTGVGGGVGHRGSEIAGVQARVRELPGGPPRLLVAKPGLDGHSNGAEQIAVAARDAGFEVVYQGIRLTPAQIAAAARDEDVDVVGISILSGSHLQLVPEVVRLLREEGVDAPVVVGGIVPAADVARLRASGVIAIYTPKDFEITQLVEELAQLAEKHRADRTVTSS
jgi:(2R)-ethylmalonyl-CoA mutase